MSTDEPTTQLNITYHPSPYPKAMWNDLEEIAEVCDGVYLPFAEGNLEYESKSVKAAIDMAHEFNLIVVADLWGYGNLFACGAIPSLFTVQHPECNCISNLGRSLPKSCPNKPAVREFMRTAVAEFIEKYGADGIFWDEPSYGLAGYLGKLEDGEWLCRCPDCQTLYREQHGEDMPTELTESVEAFRNQTMLAFLSDLCGYVKACGTHLITSTCVMTSDSYDFRAAVAQTADLDILGVDPYWRPHQEESQRDFIEKYAKETLDMGRENGKLVESWVCSWKLDPDSETDPYWAAKINAAAGVDYLSAWSYRDYVSWDQCDRPGADPERAWKWLKQAYREIRHGNLDLDGDPEAE
ncbi:MAG: hypothetical protein GY851_27290 [bacterium]|nr:hypothetical protein [bacterium]